MSSDERDLGCRVEEQSSSQSESDLHGPERTSKKKEPTHVTHVKRRMNLRKEHAKGHKCGTCDRFRLSKYFLETNKHSCVSCCNTCVMCRTPISSTCRNVRNPRCPDCTAFACQKKRERYRFFMRQARVKRVNVKKCWEWPQSFFENRRWEEEKERRWEEERS